MSGDDKADRADSLDDRLKAARQEYENDYNPKPKGNHHSEGASIAYEFLAYVISGFILGFAIDRYLGTSPWGLMGSLLLGFVGGVMRANARQKKSFKKTGN